MGYTEDMLVKSDGHSNSSTGDSGRGHSQDDIQWVHQPGKKLNLSLSLR